MRLKHRISNLLRGRYIIAIVGMVICIIRPDIAQWVVALAGIASGVSAIDAIQSKGTQGGDGNGQ